MLRLERSSGQLEKKSEKTHESYLSTVIADALCCCLALENWARSTLLRDLIAIESERRLYRSFKGQFSGQFWDTRLVFVFYSARFRPTS